jgi:rod shape-determining protein MreB and related proteins
MMQFLGRVFRHIGIDLGSTRVRVWNGDRGVVLDESACLAIDQKTKKIVAFGEDARLMEGRVSRDMSVVWPIKQGVIDQPDMAVALVRVLLNKVIARGSFWRPAVMVSVPSGADVVARQALVSAVYRAGAREVYLIAQPLAAAIGAGVPIADASGTFILHLGGGVVEGAIISLGSIVKAKMEISAGLAIDKAIQQQLESTQQLVVSRQMAAELKHVVGTLTERAHEQLVSGQDLVTGAPKEIMISSQDLKPALQPFAERYLELLQRVLEIVPPELTADIIDKGMVMSGAAAQLHGLDQYLVHKLGISVVVVEQPHLSVINGIGTALEHLDLFKESLGYQT